jgi:hypothetical protein
MKKIISVLMLALAVCVYSIYADGPPKKTITITVENTCDWSVPVGLGKDISIVDLFSSQKSRQQKEEKKIDWKIVPANGKVTYTKVEAGIVAFTFFIQNETTGKALYNTTKWQFLKNFTVKIIYNEDKMYYDWSWVAED